MVVALVIGFAFSMWSGVRMTDAEGSTRKHSKMSTWEPMGGGRLGKRGEQLQKESQRACGRGV